jgi:hypothetical protein
MYGQYRNSGIYSLSTYEEACARYDNVKPIAGKGRNAGLRPLGHRNKMQFQIRKTGDVIECVCYDTPVVTFHPDGVIAIKDDGYVSQTTAHFIRDVLGIGASVADKDLVISVNGNDYRLKSGMKLKEGELGTYEVVESAPHDVYHVDRKKLNALRKQVQPYRTFLVGMIKMREPVFEIDELIEVLVEMGYRKGDNWGVELTPWRQDVDQVLPRLQAFFEVISQEDKGGNWYRASLQMLWSGDSYRTKLHVRVDAALRRLDDLLIATHPEVLLVSQCEPGVFQKNAYERFRPYKELKA